MLRTNWSKMYPQQQQHLALPFTTNLHQHQHQQPYYSANPFLLPFPVTSDSVLHPPGTDPLGNSTTPFSVAASDYAYGAQTTGSQNWIVKQAEPIRYDLAVGSSHETSASSASLPSAWNATWSQHQIFTNDTTTLMLPNKTNVTKPMRCAVCKIDCNSKDVYEKHISGKKHKRNLQVQTNPTVTLLPGSSHANVQSHPSSIQGQVLIGAVGEVLESKKPMVLSGGATIGGATIDSEKVCSVCNVVCTSQDVYNKHLAGKRHAAQVGLMSNNGIGPYIAEFKRHGVGAWKKGAKKIKVAQSAWCEVCKINCNSRDMYIAHLSGKKHLKNLEKLSKPTIDAGTGAATAANASQPIIGPQEKPDANKPKPQKAPEMDMETKKRKVVEGGAAAGAVRSCTLCNVVCNSQTVFNAHLAGHKHAAMVKKAGSSAG